MTSLPTPVATSVDPFALMVTGAVAATFVTVWLYFYLPLTSASGRWFLRQTRRRLTRSSRFLSVRGLGHALWLVDVSIVLGWRLCVVAYAAVIMLLVVPALLAVGSLALAASLIHF